MLRKKALRKIYITTVSIFIIMIAYLFQTKVPEQALDTNLEVEYLANYTTNDIYLLNSDNLLVKTSVLVENSDLLEQIKQIINNLNENSSQLFDGFKGLIPRNTTIKHLAFQDGIVTIDFSKEFLKMPKVVESAIVEAITYSICSLKDVTGVIITVEGKPLKELPHSKHQLPAVLTKKIGINKQFDLMSFNNYNRFTVYYLTNINDEHYYVPVTKYINTTKDKIKVIIESLASSYIYEPNLMSYLNQATELLDYKIDDEYMILNFNDAIFNDDQNILEEVLYSISYSVLANYDVTKVVFAVQNDEIIIIDKSDL